MNELFGQPNMFIWVGRIWDSQRWCGRGMSKTSQPSLATALPSAAKELLKVLYMLFLSHASGFDRTIAETVWAVKCVVIVNIKASFNYALWQITRCLKGQKWDGYSRTVCHFFMLYSTYFSPTEPCKEDNFQCKNGECVPLVNLCDSFPHCKDGSDEAHCGTFYF